MKQLKYSLALLCCLSLLMHGCVEEFNAQLPDGDTDLLVVDGNIISDSTVIFSLSRSVSLDDVLATDVYDHIDAEVNVVGSDGSIYKGKNLGLGRADDYRVTIGKLNPQVLYHLEIKWNGDTYTSTPQQPLETEEFALNFKQIDETSPVQVQATTNPATDGKTSYYIWDYEEDWEIRTAYRSRFVFDPDEGRNGAIIEYSEAPYDQGWIHKTSNSILISSTDNFQDNRLKNKTIYHIDYTDNRISHLYSTLVTQRKITKGEYEYYQCKERYTNNMSGLFTPQPSELPTNITCDNKNKRVIGYVGVNMNVVKQRLFIPTTEVYYEQDYKCVPRNHESFEGADYKEIYDQGYQISYYSALPGAPIIIRWVNTRCVDCRAFDANPDAKPDFWPNN